MYMYMELVYHLPLSVWAIGALVRGNAACLSSASISFVLMCCFPDDPRVPVHLLVYAVQTAVTTATCIADYLSWSEYLNSQKIELGKLYVPYLALCMFLSSGFGSQSFTSLTDGSVAVFMAVDMLGRLHAVVGERKTVRDKKTQ
jgi:hypothetical protein